MEQAVDSEHNRLRWQCRRGMRELDEMLGLYLAVGYDKLERADKACFNRLLDYPDTVLVELLMGRMTPTDMDVAHLVQTIRNTVAP